MRKGMIEANRMSKRNIDMIPERVVYANVQRNM